MAGPFTSSALGENMPEVEPPQMNTGAPSVATTTTGSAPVAYDPGNPNAFAQRGTFTLGQPDVRAYPSSFQQDDNPNVFQFREGNVYVPHAGNLAMDVIYNRGAEITKRKQQLDDQIKNFDLYANIGKAPTDYERNFRQLAINDLNSFRKNLADTYYGGDTRAADKAILSDPTMNRAWKERSKQWEIFGRQAQERFDDAANFKALYEAGKVERSPLAQRRYETALNVLRATGNFGANGQGDPGEIIRGWDRADQQQSLEQWIKEQVMPNAKYALQTLQDRGELVKGPNGFRFFNEDKRKSFEQLRDYARREALSWGYPAEDVDIALKGVFPDSYVEETKVIQPRAAKGKSGGAKETITTTVSMDTITDPFGSETHPNLASGTPSEGYTPRQVRVLNIRSKDGSDFNKPVTFRVGANATETIYPWGVIEDPETGLPEYIVGNSVTDATKTTSTLNTGPEDKEEDDATTKKTITQKDSSLVRVPVLGNEGILDQLLPKGWRENFSRRSSSGGGNPADPLGIL